MDFNKISSQEILDSISRHCPEALSTYFQCVNRADAEGVVYFSREMIEVDLSETYTKFRNSIKALARENLLEWHPSDHGISVTLAAIDEDE
jgi:hypothetical protein